MKKVTFLTLLSTLVLFVANVSVSVAAPKLTFSCQPKVPAKLLK